MNIAQNSFEKCIKCTICTVYCPVAKANPNYPGPKECGPDGARLRIKSLDYYDQALKLCTNCKRCETACPSNVNVGDIIAVARGKFEKKVINPKLMRDFILSQTDLFGTLSTPFAPIVNKITDSQIIKTVMHKTIGIDKHKALPKYSLGTFRNWFKKNAPDQEQYPRQVSYFHGCYVNYNDPDLGKDLLKVLNAMNIGLKLLNKEKCCGVPLIANGFHDKARKNARFNVKNMTEAVEKFNTPILSTSSTCSFTLKQEYPHVLDVDNSQVVDKIEYITSFLLREFMNGNAPKLKEINKTIVYHTPCHLERSGLAIFTIELLRAIPGLKVIVLESECCGLAGTYGFKKENYDVSMKIGKHLFETIKNSDADYAITDCETCKWQIEENTHLKTIHPINLLAQGLTV
ncbi:anaerobic glycerol-3-phosphate dehydrogenase subunit GlpC [Psychromonas ossibalaenae]|uniref:anaerobic glycerol-3-phosphate dehydrogenase subunit GlpC n=1 Tax=Psychromonas ossibalaenae TaxID=444922 RepID=UPI000375F42F|nr:anaerobic glycerol-3-phosphate dehydrogenase subunit GlpC [Psychromonas ossibalaenae]